MLPALSRLTSWIVYVPLLSALQLQRVGGAVGGPEGGTEGGAAAGDDPRALLDDDRLGRDARVVDHGVGQPEDAVRLRSLGLQRQRRCDEIAELRSCTRVDGSGAGADGLGGRGDPVGDRCDPLDRREVPGAGPGAAGRVGAEEREAGDADLPPAAIRRLHDVRAAGVAVAEGRVLATDAEVPGGEVGTAVQGVAGGRRGDVQRRGHQLVGPPGAVVACGRHVRRGRAPAGRPRPGLRRQGRGSRTRRRRGRSRGRWCGPSARAGRRRR